MSTVDPWNWVADGYVELTAPKLMLYAEEAIADAQLLPQYRVLDVAAGPGSLACRVARSVAQVTAVDFSPQMVAICQRQVQLQALDNVTVLEGDGQELKLGSEQFERAFSLFGLMFFPNRAKGFSELHRLLVPGGKALVTSWAPLSESPLMTSMIEALRVAEPSILPPKAELATLENPERFEYEMQQAGFTDVSIRRLYKDWAFKDFDDLFERMIRGSVPLEIMKRQVSETEWERRVEVMRAQLFERFGPKPSGLGSTAWLGQGTRP